MAEETKVNENVNFDGAYGYWRLREDGVLEWITADPHVQLTDLAFAPGFIKIDNVSGKVVDNGLSPNPDGSGYVKQVNTSALANVVNPEENVLYVVGDRKFKYLKTDIIDPGTNKIIIPHGFNRVFAIPELHQVKGEHGTPRKENVTPKEIPQVFPYPVAFLKEVYVKGKKLEDEISALKLYRHQITMSCSGGAGSGLFKVDIISAKGSAYTKATLESDETIRGFYIVLKQNTTTFFYEVFTNGYLTLQANQKGITINSILGYSISSIMSDNVTQL